MTDYQTLPFQVSSRALEHIRGSSQPKAALQAAMVFAWEDTESDAPENVPARFDGDCLWVGYQLPQKVSDWTRLKIGGNTLAVSPDTLARLEGRKLMLKKKSGPNDIYPYYAVVAV